jgi:hypothetical protein
VRQKRTRAHCLLDCAVPDLLEPSFRGEDALLAGLGSPRSAQPQLPQGQTTGAPKQNPHRTGRNLKGPGWGPSRVRRSMQEITLNHSQGEHNPLLQWHSLHLPPQPPQTWVCHPAQTHPRGVPHALVEYFRGPCRVCHRVQNHPRGVPQRPRGVLQGALPVSHPSRPDCFRAMAGAATPGSLREVHAPASPHPQLIRRL